MFFEVLPVLNVGDLGKGVCPVGVARPGGLVCMATVSLRSQRRTHPSLVAERTRGVVSGAKHPQREGEWLTRRLCVCVCVVCVCGESVDSLLRLRWLSSVPHTNSSISMRN